jgi:hypothetical protein
MSARKIDRSLFPSAPLHQRRLTLSPEAVRFRRSGIEFRTARAIAAWTEVTVDLQSPRDTRKIHCTGVVVACEGEPRTGYLVSLLFTNLSSHSQAVLNSLAQDRLN